MPLNDNARDVVPDLAVEAISTHDLAEDSLQKIDPAPSILNLPGQRP
jgi:hypothetical protein